MRCVLALAVLAACSSPEAPSVGELRFLEGAVLAPAGAGRAVGGDRSLVELDWTPGAEATVGGVTARAPRTPECLPLFAHDLGDVNRVVALGGAEPSTSMAWSPDGARLAVGSHRGELLVLDGWTGAVHARRTLAETMVKTLEWSADGATLYAAEQSPDAFVHALDPADLSARWSVRLADDLGTSPIPPATDVFGVFTLPSAHRIAVLPGGDLLVTGVHSWPVDGEHQNRSRVYRLAPDGTRRAAWPPEGPADAVLRLAAIDAEAGVIALSVTRSAAGDPPADLPVGGVQLLRAEGLRPSGTVDFEPLPPHFTSTFVWEAFDVRGDPPTLLAGFGDGRLQVVQGEGRTVHEVGTPILSGDVPIAAAVGWGGFVAGGSAAVTTNTNIPWGSASPATRPPSAHPGSNTVFVHDEAGAVRWTWHGEHALTGFSRMGDDRLVVGAGARSSDTRRDLWGALVFGLEGEPRPQRFCPTEGPVFFRHRATADGRVAVAVLPWKDEDEAVHGAYQVVVLR